MKSLQTLNHLKPKPAETLRSIDQPGASPRACCNESLDFGMATNLA